MTDSSDLGDPHNHTPSLTAAEALKAEGNELFRTSQWTEALVAYRSALGHLPPRKSKSLKSSIPELSPPSSPPDGDEKMASDVAMEENATGAKESSSQSEGDDEVGEAVESEEVDEYAKLRAVLHGNIGACHVQLEEHKEAVEACTQALLDDPHYVKALQRRAVSNVKLDTWSSLTAAEADYKSLLELLPASLPQRTSIERTLRDLKPRTEAAQKREMADMLDKLKGFGNSILGNFGLSTDSFKFEPNGQGGYSVNFQQ